jgi:hypothetical protein
MWTKAAPYGGVYPCRLITVTGTRARFRTYWYTGIVKAITPSGHSELATYVDRCPNHFDAHEAHAPLEDVAEVTAWRRWEAVTPDGPEDKRWPSVCEHCSALAPAETSPPYAVGARVVELRRHVDIDRLYSNPSGELEVGNLVYLPCHRGKGPGDVCPYWDNCDGRHLHAVLPNGHMWDIDSRANNCTLKEERTHRCWTKEGDPAVHLTVGKTGPTCAAGAGSIRHGDYHGFLDGHVIAPNRGMGRPRP